MLKLPRNQDVEIDLGTGEIEVVGGPGRYSSAPGRSVAALAKPRSRGPSSRGQSSAPPPAYRSAPVSQPASQAPVSHGHRSQAPASFAPASSLAAQQQAFRPARVPQFDAHGMTQPMQPIPSASSQQPAQSYPPQQMSPSYAPPPPVPWAPAYASSQFPASMVAPPPSSLAAIADPTSQHAAIVSGSSSRKSGTSGMVWAATLVVMGAFLGAMYGVYMRGGAPVASAAAAQAPQAPVAPAPQAAPVVPAQPVAQAPQVAAPVAAPPSIAVVGSPGLLGPASPVGLIPAKPAEEPVAANGKGKPGHHGKPGHTAAAAPPAPAAPHGSHVKSGGQVAAAVPVPHKPPPAAPAAPVKPKSAGKSDDDTKLLGGLNAL